MPGSADMKDMFEWSNNYSVGIGSIDAQHQNLFAIARELHAAMTAGQGKASLARILDRLVQYTAVHFAHEERLMRLARLSRLRRAQGGARRARPNRSLKFQEDFQRGSRDHYGPATAVPEGLAANTYSRVRT